MGLITQMKNHSIKDKTIIIKITSPAILIINNSSLELNPTIFYREGIPGPYSVWVRSTTSNKEISHFKIGSIVYKKYNSIKDIFKRSRSKVEIILTSREQANEL
ncbi:hypothetical protein TKK_0006402 [Trichogramma kaykai]